MIYQDENLTLNYITKEKCNINTGVGHVKKQASNITIAHLLFDAKGSVNKLNLSTLNSLKKVIDILDGTHQETDAQRAKETNIEGLLISSAKDSFIVGADINEFLALFSKGKESLSQWLSDVNKIFNRIEDLPFPTLSAVNGFTLGGGCECVLSTDFRLADGSVQIGLPETQLGIMPGWGGSVRLPRVIGTDPALKMITTGKPKRADDALKIGIIDGIVSRETLIDSSMLMLEKAITGKLNWKNRRQQKKSPAPLSKSEAMMSFSVAKAMTKKATGDHYPAPITAVKSIEESLYMDREQALDIENKHFITLTQTDAAKSLVTLFLNNQSIKNKAKKQTKHNEKIKETAVLGAGIMGGGIAYQSAFKGTSVLMKDIEQSSLNLGMEQATKLLNARLNKGHISPLKMAQILSSITPSLNYLEMKKKEIIVEAVIENPTIKANVLSEVEKEINNEATLVSNTSTIPISLLAKSLQRPENFCGMHFFNPVHKMPLVEIIKGEKTSQKTINHVVHYATQMGKVPVVVNDCPGFFVNRVLFPYFAAFSMLITDGANYLDIDKIMETKFGWPMGPAYLLDVVGIDTAHHAQKVMSDGYPERMAKDKKDIIDLMYEAKHYGQKNKLGFYHYQLDKKGRPQKEIKESEKVKALINIISDKEQTYTQDDIISRMMIPMINEVIRCLDEKIIASPQEADLALVYGLGFPPFRGGIFHYLDSMGLTAYVKRAEEFQHLGSLYEVPNSLKEKALKNERYYSTPTPLNVKLA